MPSSIADKLSRRRESNRKSQQKSREHKDALIKTLQEENKQLRQQVSSGSVTSQFRSSVSSAVLRTPVGSYGALAVDLEACRQAFLAVLASVCDPHLNTIHAVCQKWSQARGQTQFAPTLYAPRPVNRPLNYSGPTLFSDYNDLSFTDLAPDSYIPPLDNCGPLSVPYLEPAHPLFNLELDANDVWGWILGEVDIGKTDAEFLAGRIVEKVRCYGFGPVVLKTDLEEVCRGYPKLMLDMPMSQPWQVPKEEVYE